MKNPLVFMLWKKAGEPIFLEINKIHFGTIYAVRNRRKPLPPKDLRHGGPGARAVTPYHQRTYDD